MNRIDTFLQLVVNQNGSDLHLVAGNPPRIRLYGELFPVKYRELTRDETADLILDTMSATVRQGFESRHSLDYAYEVSGLARFRVNAFRHLGGLGAVFRVIRTTIRTLDELAMPAVLKTFYDSFGKVCKARGNNIDITFSPLDCSKGGGKGNATYKLTFCVLTSVGVSMAAQDMIVNEQSQLIFGGMDYAGA